MDKPSRTSIEVRELDCAAEEQVLRKAVGTMPGVSDLDFDVMNRRMIVVHDSERATAEAIADRVRSVGMTPVVSGPTGKSAPTISDGPVWPEVEQRVQLPIARVASKREMTLLGTSGVLAFAAEGIAWSTASEHTWPASWVTVMHRVTTLHSTRATPGSPLTAFWSTCSSAAQSSMVGTVEAMRSCPVARAAAFQAVRT